MKRDKRDRGSFFGLIAKNYAILSITVGVFIFLTLACVFLLNAKGLEGPNYEALLANPALAAEDYSALPLEKTLGRKSWAVVLDAAGAVLYTSPGHTAPAFTPGELACIADTSFGEDAMVEHTGGLTVLTWRSFDPKTYEQKTLRLTVLDAQGKVLYSTQAGGPAQYTAQELVYLTDTPIAGMQLRRAAFTAQDGTPRTLLLYVPVFDAMRYDHVMRLSLLSIPVLLIFYIFIAGGIGLWLTRKVRRPIQLLGRSMAQFAQNGADAPVEYSGPREFVQVFDIFNDMTRRLREAEEDKLALEAARQKMLADISHDLKTPVTVIQGFSKAICDGVIAPEKQPEYLLAIYRKSTVVTQLINSFYEYAKLEHPDFQLALEKTDACEELRAYLGEKYSELDAAHFQLSPELPDTPLWCMADRLQLHRVFENIVANMLKHNPAGTTVFAAARQENGMIVLTLADDGVGIDPALAQTVFEPFVVGDASRRSGKGTGLGLAIARRILEAHGGAIRLQLPPAPPYHTQFVLTLPVLKAAPHNSRLTP